ncbi:hypothetical protein TURU_080961 [Turdus rufiventris]|nr:hypothetical protein TURU_080961 [Turdus rufiventris]
MEALITPSVPQSCPSLQLQACGEVAKWRLCATRTAEVPLPPGMLAGFVGPEQCNPGPCQPQQQGAGSDSDVSVTDASATDASDSDVSATDASDTDVSYTDVSDSDASVTPLLCGPCGWRAVMRSRMCVWHAGTGKELQAQA